MSNTKKNRNTFRVCALLLVVCLISTVMLSGTFAKYTSEYAGQDTALVARWSFTGNFDEDELGGTEIDLPIWDHDYTTNIYEKEGDDYLIAPGIKGSFTVEFTYDADVDADLVFNFTKSGDAANKVPLQYSLDNFTTIYYDLDELEDAIIDMATNTTISGSNGNYVITDTVENGAVTISKTVFWRWPYDVNAHNSVTAADTGVAVDRTAAGFTGTGDFIQFGGSDTVYTEWTDTDDVIAGKSSHTANRDSYILNLQIKATQKTPLQ